jgi:arylsulfatase A-like enzyme
LLKARGYATAQFGKNHLGDADETVGCRPHAQRVIRIVINSRAFRCSRSGRPTGSPPA